MKSFPCAKINLGLYVTARRADGYHNLETIFYPIPLCDELEVEEADNEHFHVDGPALSGTGIDTVSPTDAMFTDNLVVRVVTLLRNEGFHIPPLNVRLHKNIPFGAGLGGGSSDAAFMMKMLHEMFHLDLTASDMEQRLARLGADCPFFVQCRPVFATGIGDQFTPISLNLSGVWLLLVKPDDAISTREAYQGITPTKPLCNLTESIAKPIDAWPSLINNDFERSVFPQHPAVAEIKQRLYRHGAAYASMSGSGSSVFGLFHDEPTSEVVRTFLPHFVFKARL